MKSVRLTEPRVNDTTLFLTNTVNLDARMNREISIYSVAEIATARHKLTGSKGSFGDRKPASVE